jgi:hypothetical protein
VSKRYQGGILGVGFNPLQAPNAPTIGAATAGNQNVSVAFTAPADVGGSAISSYRVRATPGGIGATTSSSPVTVSGLTNGTTYTFSVAAVNSYGFSPYSGTVSSTPVEPTYIEDVFSTYLYTGNGSSHNTTNTIINGIDLAGNGGLVWIKSRTDTAFNNLFDTNRGVTSQERISSNSTGAAENNNVFDAFNSNGFTVNFSAFASSSYDTNRSGQNYASWTFREAPKFFDVVTYTGNGANRTIAHNLGVAPGMILVKSTTDANNWMVYHRSTGINEATFLNLQDGAASLSGAWGTSAPTATDFGLGPSYINNTAGQTYVAYLYAHDTASDGIIQCGSYTGNGSANGPIVTLGWEPQWLLFKRANSSSGWYLIDNMRGMALTGNGNSLYPNLSTNENGYWAANFANINATGFQIVNTDGDINSSGSPYIYMAIRRGPMRTPTLGTSVFSPNLWSSSTGSTITTNFPVDMQISRYMIGTDSNIVTDRLRGLNTLTTNSNQPILSTNSNVSESNNGSMNYNYDNVRFLVGDNYTGAGWALNFRRAPGFMDVVAYTGTGSARTLNHNLGVAPELMIVKRRDSSATWPVYAASQGASSYGFLPESVPFEAAGASIWNSTNPTSSVFSVGTGAALNASGGTYVAYLFASAPGVSKVGTYVGNDTTQTINCGFAAGARFVMIKGISGGGVGDWYIWDSARGINAGNDPHLSLNRTAAQINTNDSVDADNTGFIVNQNTGTFVNFSGTTYIFLAIS